MSELRLGYLGMQVRDAEAVSQIFGQVLGMQAREAATTTPGAVAFRMDERHHRIMLLPGSEDRVAYVGWETASVDALHALAECVAARGTTLRRGSQAELAARHVLEMYWFHAPDGVRTEIAFGLVEDATPFVPAYGGAGFRTGEQGLGHIVLGSTAPESTVRFYRESLGFSPSDYIRWDVADVTFLHCNTRHHSLAVMNAVYGTAPGQLNHVMVQANAMDDVGRAYDRVRELEIPVVLTLGKHSNDHMTSFYIQTPGGWAIEYGHGAREIDADWQVQYYDSPRLWGHHLQQPAAPLR